MGKVVGSLGLALTLLLSATALAKAPSAKERAQALEIYRTIVEMDTSEPARNVEMAKYLAKQFEDAGFPERDIHIIEKNKTAALVVRYRGDGSGGKPILLLAHMDVVPAKRADWERDPFKLIEEKGYFFGRGTSDNKSGVAALTWAFIDLRADGFKPTRDLVIVFTGDEETSGNTAKALLKEHRELVDAEFALNTDAGGGELDEKTGKPLVYHLQTAEKTFASFKLTARNPGGHSSQPRADNAIYDLMEALQRVRAYAFPVMWNETTLASLREGGRVTKGAIGKAMRRFAAKPGDRRAAKVLSASPFHVGQIRTTCIATMLEGGHADNALPQSASATVNCRIFPGVSIARVQATLQRLVGPKIEIKPLDEYLASDASPLRPDVVAAVKKVVAKRTGRRDLPVVPRMSAGASDGVFFRAEGIPTYGVGEIFIKDSDDFAHGLNERVPVDSFYAGLAHWRDLLTEIAGPKK